MNISQFFNTHVPFPLQADAYTISADIISNSRAREKSVYNFTNRISPAVAFPDIANDSRMISFGLQDFIRRYLTKPVTAEDVELSAEFMERANSFGGALPFNKEMWESVVYDYNGYLPIVIKGLPEGSVFFPNEPSIQVESLDSGFGELACHIEALMVGMYSILTCRATLTKHWKNSVYNMLVNEHGYNPDEVAPVIDWFIHDFGMRASSNDIESETLGKAHLLSFNGTDTFNAAYRAWADTDKDSVPYGTSIMALAHRNVQGYENNKTDGELECFNRNYEVSKKYGNVAANVSDCYSFNRAVDKLKSILDRNFNDRTVIVARPDSGNATNNIEYILDKKDGRLRFIEGNSINPKSMRSILTTLKAKKPALKGIFGVGGHLRNSCTRDTLSSAYKLAAIAKQYIPVCKLSEIDVKMSIPGPNIVTDPMLTTKYTSVYFPGEVPSSLNRLTVFYDGDNLNTDYKRYSNVCLEDFDVIRNRVTTDFNRFEHFSSLNPNYGTDCKNLSALVQDVRTKTFEKYRKESK